MLFLFMLLLLKVDFFFIVKSQVGQGSGSFSRWKFSQWKVIHPSFPPPSPMAWTTSSQCSSHQIQHGHFFLWRDSFSRSKDRPVKMPRITSMLMDRARAPNCVSKDPATIFGMEWHKLSRMTGTKAFQSWDSGYRRLERHGWCKKSFFLTFHSKKSQKS